MAQSNVESRPKRGGGDWGDPTANVKALTEAEAKRQDDLRVAAEKHQAAELSCAKEIGNIRADHLKDVGALRAEHQKEMATAESKRLDAVRAVDQLAVNTAAERALAAIQTLAATTATNADNLRSAMTTTATTIAQQRALADQQLMERIMTLEKSSYEGKGKSTITDPAMAELLAEVKRLAGAQAGSTGKSEGINAVWLILVAAVAILLPLILKFVGK